MTDVNHTIWLTKLRWKIVNKEFVLIHTLKLDCFKFEFLDGGLNQEQQELLIEFMGDTDHLNSLTPVDFCNMFRKNAIEFKLRFNYSKTRGFKHSCQCLRIVRLINKAVYGVIWW